MHLRWAVQRESINNFGHSHFFPCNYVLKYAEYFFGVYRHEIHNHDSHNGLYARISRSTHQGTCEKWATHILHIPMGR